MDNPTQTKAPAYSTDLGSKLKGQIKIFIGAMYSLEHLPFHGTLRMVSRESDAFWAFDDSAGFKTPDKDNPLEDRADVGFHKRWAITAPSFWQPSSVLFRRVDEPNRFHTRCCERPIYIRELKAGP